MVINSGQLSFVGITMPVTVMKDGRIAMNVHIIDKWPSDSRTGA